MQQHIFRNLSLWKCKIYIDKIGLQACQICGLSPPWTAVTAHELTLFIEPWYMLGFFAISAFTAQLEPFSHNDNLKVCNWYYWIFIGVRNAKFRLCKASFDIIFIILYSFWWSTSRYGWIAFLQFPIWKQIWKFLLAGFRLKIIDMC